MRIDFMGIGFGRSGSNWLAHCLYEHPQISIPKFNLLTEINYFPEEYEVMGLKNYIKKFEDCNYEKVVGEISTLIINQRRSVKLIKKLFPNVKIIIYQRDEKGRMNSLYNMTKYHDMLPARKVRINQEALIKPWLKEFGKQVFIFDMENKDKQGELNRLFRFLGVKQFTPSVVNKRLNESYTHREKGVVRTSNYPFLRKIINLLKPGLREHKKLFYTLKRMWNIDYYFQIINHRI